MSVLDPIVLCRSLHPRCHTLGRKNLQVLGRLRVYRGWDGGYGSVAATPTLLPPQNHLPLNHTNAHRTPRPPPSRCAFALCLAGSFERTTTHYTEKVTTQQRGVVEGVKYYVAPKFKQNYASTREQLRRVSGAVAVGVMRRFRGGFAVCVVGLPRWRCLCRWFNFAHPLKRIGSAVLLSVLVAHVDISNLGL